MPEALNQGAVRVEKQLIVIDSSAGLEGLSQRELALQHRDGSRAELNDTVFMCFGGVFVDAEHARFAHRQGTLHLIKVADSKGDFV